MIRKGLVHTINWAGMGCLVVGSAADGRSGLSSILQKRPDVVITDIRMPEMDGLEMLERALAVYSFRIILLTSYAVLTMHAGRFPCARAITCSSPWTRRSWPL